MHNTIIGRNIVLLFDDKLNQEFIRLSSEIAERVDSKIVLNNTDTFPHVSLYQALFPAKNEEKLEQGIEQVLKNFKPFPVTFDSKSVILNTLFVDAARNEQLQALHESLVDSLNDLREGINEEEKMAKDVGGELPTYVKESMRKYGMWAAKEHYMPHVSIARVFDPTEMKQALSLVPETFSYQATVSKISLIESGPHGTCKKVLKSFTL